MADYKGVLADLRTKRDALIEEAKRLDGVISALEDLSGKRVAAGASSTASVSFKGMTLKAAIEKAIETAGEDMETNGIVETLRSGGFEYKASRPYASVYSTLFRLSEGDGPVVKSKSGKWGLRKWSRPLLAS